MLNLAERRAALLGSDAIEFVELLAAAGYDPARDLKLFDWSGADFSGCKLSQANFTGANLEGCNFRGAKIAEARFDRAVIDRSTLRAAADWEEHVRRWRKPAARGRDQHLPELAFFSDAPFAPELVALPAGEFWMGSREDEVGRWDPEGPRHKVRIEYRFAIGRYPVTFEEYDWFCDATKREKPADESWGRGRRPAVNVSWNDAQEYVRWLSNHTGRHYRLPSEAEWEYACRGGTETRFWFGDGFTDAPPADQPRLRAHLQSTTEVDRGDPNPFGLYQVHGNVWEWTQDEWHDSYLGAPADGSAWQRTRAAAATERVLRGGGPQSVAMDFRSARRVHGLSGGRGSTGSGFRVARSLEHSPKSGGHRGSVRKPSGLSRHENKEQVQKGAAEDVKFWKGGKAPSWADERDRDEHLTDLGVFSDAPFAPEMVVVPAGTSWMGSYETAEFEEDEFRYRGERRSYQVTIDDPFAIGRYAVTFEEFDCFCVSQGLPKPPDEGWGRGRRPVINVSWDDAQRYVSWLGDITGRRYRLPTETEWEYACRAGTATEFAFGDKLSSEHAHCGRFDRTAEVGSYIPNAWGIYDMHGNVCEWVGDGGYTREHNPKSNFQVIRGGYYGDSLQDCRSGHPDWSKSDTGASFIGFRVACELGREPTNR